MTRVRTIVSAAGVLLLLSACGTGTATTAASRPDPAPVSSTAAENLGMTMLAWEFQTKPEQKALCTRVRAEGVSGTVDAYRAEHGGAAADWTASATWLVTECRKGWNR